ncbi:MAG: acetolactate synthase small subunit [Planctomycetota bacterium]|jgi:acetolactate synthase-1/3 small subunit
MKHIISALVQNQPGVLSQISGMFSARGFNIDSLVVGRTEDPDLSRMTIAVLGDDHVLEQAVKQLAKLVAVVDVADHKDLPCVDRDLMLARIAAPEHKRADVVDLVNLFRGRVVDVSHDSVIVELAGQEAKIEGFIELARPHGLIELARTGIISMPRGLHRSRTHSAARAPAKKPRRPRKKAGRKKTRAKA